MTKTTKINRTCCVGKIAYLTDTQAEDAAADLAARGRGVLVAYACEVCGYFHVGHPGKRKPEAKR